MHVLFVHQNFPAQFGHIAARLAAAGWTCSFATESNKGQIPGVRKVLYGVPGGATEKTHYCSRTFENAVWRTHAVYAALANEPEIRPDLVVGHSGFGSTLFLRERFDCPVVNYFEFFYGRPGTDSGFRPEFPSQEIDRLRAKCRNAMILLDLEECDAGYSPTEWQRALLPGEYQHKMRTIFDGVDTDLWRPRTEAELGLRLIAGREFPADRPLVTYVSRGLESMRGFDVFMRIAKRIYTERPDAHFVCVGSDRVCYGGDLKFIKEKTFREHVLAQDSYDLERFHFTGLLPTAELARLLAMSDLHLYFTVPFVLSWSLIDAMASGAPIVASGTAPVREVLRHEENALLADFFDEDALTRHALRVLNDRGLARSLGGAALEDVHAKFALSVTLPKLKTLFEDVAAGGGTRQASVPVPSR